VITATDGPASPLARMADIRARFSGAPARSGSTFAGALAAAGSLLDGSAADSLPLDATSATGTATADPSGGGVTGDDVVDTAKGFLGIPYVWGGSDPSTGLDCSGLVQNVFHRLGIDLPRTSREQARVGTPVASLADARPGDVLAFGSPVHHVGIYLGDGRMIEAPGRGKDVRISELGSRTPTAIRRMTGPGTAAAASSGIGRSSVSTAVSGTGISAAVRAYAPQFAAAAQRWGVPAGVLAAVAQTESGGDAGAVSPAGARGLMQFMPGTAKSYGIDPMDPSQSIDAAARMLSQLRDRFGSIELALAAYNAGPGAVQRYGGVPPYSETQRYVSKVMGLAGGAR
jgi:cell wall-associated NlpC family hydrolase